MKRLLIYLAIFALFFWSCWTAILWLTQPTNHGQYSYPIIVSFFLTFFGGFTFTMSFIIAIVKNFLPNRKLPHLLIRDSLLHGALAGFWASGLLMLQLLRVATLLNTILWLSIFTSIEWYLYQRQTKSTRDTKR
jgi:hypothetical protein